MATLILSAVGTAVGGPVGGAVGALLGRAVDTTIIGSSSREGPRLTELAVTTSSYGQPIPRVYGTMRLPGTIIWATDLVESSETSGGKGQPKTTSYSYSVSFAVALSSRPVSSIGRIWADGALLRGAAGDLKVGGTLRLHPGHEDAAIDPLIAADKGGQTCAFRGIAYAVFENLELASFGNRIPALSFEVIAADGTLDLVDLLGEIALAPSASVPLTGLAGYADRGGARTVLLADMTRLFPFAAVATPAGLALAPMAATGANPLPSPVVGRAGGEDRAVSSLRRRSTDRDAPTALRYYDPARDFQPSLQHAPGATGNQREIVEFAGVFAAPDARACIADLRHTALTRRETLAYRVAEATPELAPGRCVTREGDARIWLVRSTETHADGVDLLLERVMPSTSAQPIADAGTALVPVDEAQGELTLRYFELPWDGTGAGNVPQRYAAVSRTGARGAIALAGVDNETLVPLALSARGDAVQGHSLTALPASPALVFEPDGVLDIALTSEHDQLQSVDERALLDGANRLLLGEEVLQFRFAQPLGAGEWRLTGLLRGRGGTEHHAATGHATGAPAVLLEERLLSLGLVSYAEIAALSGIGDAEPVYASLTSGDTTLRPLAPVHPGFAHGPGGDPQWRWVRRARGAWRWLDGVETPLAEEREAYRVGFGPVDAPVSIWDISESFFTLPAADWAALKAAYPQGKLWVRQVGSHAVSLPSILPH
ncbi:MAG: hypothetical protein CL808_05820 [Citromicrobium sp.]|nr:hypothetical protein [Citromicrobium sp.]